MSLKLVKLKTSRNWYVRGTVRRQSVFETAGTEDREEAEAFRIRKEKELLDRSLYGDRPSRSFAAAALAFMEAPGASPKEQRFILPLTDAFGHLMLPDLTQERLDDYIAKQYRDRSPATVLRNVITPITSVLNFAARRRWCDPPKFDRPKQPKGRRRWATYEEAERLINAAPPHLQRLIIFLLWTGSRMSEALELEWRDVDAESRWLVFANTKRAEARGICIHPVLKFAMVGNRQRRVFLTQRGQPYADKERESGGQIKTAWRATLKVARITDLRPHDLRHTFSTWLTMAGVHEQVRDELMGHASTDMGRRYSHIPRASLVEAVNRLPGLVIREKSVKRKKEIAIYSIVPKPLKD